MDDLEKLRYMFPRGSRSFFEANETKTNTQIQSPQPEYTLAEALDLVREGQTQSHGRFTVRIVSCRVRPIDPDNLAAGCKALVDCLRSGGLIPGDDPTQIKLEVEQERVSSYSQERTDVELTYPD